MMFGLVNSNTSALLLQNEPAYMSDIFLGKCGCWWPLNNKSIDTEKDFDLL